MTEQQFNEMYWAHQPPEVRAQRGNMDSSEAATLAMKGYAIDVPIMVWGWSAYNVMSLRQSYGFTWVPSALQPPLANGPGVTLPNQEPYDPKNPPAGSIKVSLDPTDYPPFVETPTNAPAVDYDAMIGLPVLGIPNYFYIAAPVPGLVDGQDVQTKTKGRYRFHRVGQPGPFGVSYAQYFERI